MSYVFPTKNGKVLSTQQGINGNCISSTAQYIFLNKTNEPRLEFYYGLTDFLRGPGILSRYWDKEENTSLDDYLAASCLKSLTPGFYVQGKYTGGTFDLFNPHKSQWNK